MRLARRAAAAEERLPIWHGLCSVTITLAHSHGELVDQRRPKTRSKPQMAGFADVDEQFMRMLDAFLRPLSASQLSIAQQAPRSANLRKKVPLSKSATPHALRRKGSP